MDTPTTMARITMFPQLVRTPIDARSFSIIIPSHIQGCVESGWGTGWRPSQSPGTTWPTQRKLSQTTAYSGHWRQSEIVPLPCRELREAGGE